MSLVTLPNFDPTPGSASIDLPRLPVSYLLATLPARHPAAPLHTRRITCLDDPSLPAVLGLWRRSFPERERAPLSCWVGRLKEYAPGSTSSRNLIAATLPGDSRPVGMAYYEVRREGDGESPVGYLVYLATDPGYRGQGMGTLLYREIVARMFAAGCRAVVFEVEMPGEVGRFCPEDGSPTRPANAGWHRHCEAHGHEQYPRTDPAVICLVHDGGTGPSARVLLARQPTWPEGRFSVLAGFVEAGASLEACVVREIHEEVGVRVRDLHYLGSQSWPFPRSLMIGFHAVADPDAPLVPADGEIAEAHWATQADLQRALDAGDWSGRSDAPFLLPGRVSIARTMLESWAAAD